MPICVTALCGRVSVQAQAGFAPAAIIPKEAVPIDPKQERHISMQSAKSPETAATSAQKKNGKKKGVVPGNVGFITLACTTLFCDFVWMKDRSGFGEMGTFFLPIMMRLLFRYRG